MQITFPAATAAKTAGLGDTSSSNPGSFPGEFAGFLWGRLFKMGDTEDIFRELVSDVDAEK